MNPRQILKILLFVVSFVLISLSGYQCSTQVIREGGTYQPPNGPSNNLGGYPGATPTAVRGPEYHKNKIRDTDDGDNCRHNKVRKAYSSTSAKMTNISNSGLTDYRFGKRANYDADCARVFVRLKSNKNKMGYSGEMSFVYYGTCLNGQKGVCKGSEITTGYQPSDARFNGWSKGERDVSVLDNTFRAIFEDTYGAYILSIEHVKESDVRDGYIRYLGAGSIYLKMFKTATLTDINTNHNQAGDCYNTGTHVYHATTTPQRPSKVCWFIDTGPFSCRPDGDFTALNLHKNNYKCFTYLGDFFGLDIEEALNIEIDRRGRIIQE